MTDPTAPPPLSSLRKSYELGALDEADAATEPMQQFERWFDAARAAGVPEPNAMTLATVGPDERPSTRVVLIKAFDARGIVWYTNYESRKARELSANPWAALQFHWVDMERQVRIEGRVEPSDPDEADRYHASRPLASRIGAWASPQSRVIASRQVLQDLTAEAEARLGTDPPRPPHWGGMRLVPDRWEFWQGRRNRLHDRLRYTARPEGGWLLERLAP